ncbi:MAG: hypothetical protein ABFD52_08925 [Acidobacteriota bacterium]
MKTLILITLVVMLIVALGRYCLWQIRRTQRNKMYVSEAYRRWLIEHEEPCFPDIESSLESEHPDRRAAVSPDAAIDGAEGGGTGSKQLADELVTAEAQAKRTANEVWARKPWPVRLFVKKPFPDVV